MLALNRTWLAELADGKQLDVKTIRTTTWPEVPPRQAGTVG
jgi:hypothetical protein